MDNFTEASNYLDEAQKSPWDSKQVKARFEKEPAPGYGEQMQKWIPGYDEAHALILDALRLHLPPASRLLDLGAGTGRVSKIILEAFDDCHISLTDFSANMLAEAPRKLAGYAGRFDTTAGDFFSEAVNYPEASFDGVVSVFAVCHGRGEETYRALYRKIQRWLKPGGGFICYDHVLGDTQKFTVLNMARWKQYMELSQSKESIQEGIVSTYQEDSPLSLRQHLRLLEEAGFSAADVLWKKDIFGVYAGVK
jgi:tRNA (cmo5U34)-methyltransferase